MGKPGKGWLRAGIEDRPQLSTHSDPQAEEVAWGSAFSIVETVNILGEICPVQQGGPWENAPFTPTLANPNQRLQLLTQEKAHLLIEGPVLHPFIHPELSLLACVQALAAGWEGGRKQGRGQRAPAQGSLQERACPVGRGELTAFGGSLAFGVCC